MASEIYKEVMSTEREMLRYGDKWKAVMSAKGRREKGEVQTGIDPGLANECTSCQLDAG
jgi:hypothetical protein